MKRLRLQLTSWNGVALGLVALRLAALSAGTGTLAAALHDMVGPLAALIVAASVLVRRPPRPQPWLLLSAGLLSLGLGDIAFESGWGSVTGDSFYVAGLLLLGLSLGQLVATGPGSRAARMLFVDATAVFASAMTVLWFFVFDAKFDALSGSAVARFEVIAFPILDLFLIALAARLALAGAVRAMSYRLLLAGVALGGTCDLFARGLGTNYHGTAWFSGNYYAAYALLAAAALHPSMRELSKVRLPEHDTFTRLRALFLGCSSAAVPIVLIGRHSQLNELHDFAGLALAATFIPLLVGYRLLDLARIARATAAALEGSEELYRRVVEDSRSLICLLDTEGRIVSMSPAAETLTGYTKEEAEGREVWSLLRPEDAVLLPGAFEAAVESGLVGRATVHAKTKTGEDLYLDGSAALVHGYGDRGGDLILAIAHDVTQAARDEAEREALEERLQEAEKMEAIGKLAGGIAHDFNNLLLAIRGYGELAVRGLQTHDLGAAERDIEEVLVAADRATDLTRQLLAFGRRQVLMPELLDLDDLICATAGQLEPLLDPRIELRALPAAAGPVVVHADRGQLTQVITNLALNARDAMPGGGALTIAAAATDGEALLTVADTGIGMSDETAEKIFEPFYTTKHHSGAGMGLATAQGIVHQSGGSIGVKTEPGEGTLFTISLPLVREEPAFDAVAAATVHGAAPSAGTILLVEDTLVVRTVVRAFLEADGYRIFEAERGEDAIALARAHDGSIDIVLTDIVLPGMNGKQMAEELSAERPNVKVLYMSGYTNDPELQAGRLPPRTAFIQKPFTGDELRAALRDLAADC
jgi:two-component system cell cycle sensor histidine kinase/response regulator CckA